MASGRRCISGKNGLLGPKAGRSFTEALHQAWGALENERTARAEQLEQKFVFGGPLALREKKPNFQGDLMVSISVQICKSHRPNVLAGASITIQFDGGGSVEIHDCRLLRNKSGILWASLPTYSVQIGRSYEYRATVALSLSLHQEVTAAILKAYEAQARTLPGGER
jgi:hypothetical protein